MEKGLNILYVFLGICWFLLIDVFDIKTQEILIWLVKILLRQ